MKTLPDLAGWPVHLCTTFQKLHDANACPTGYGKLANFIRDHFAVTPKDFGMTRPIPVAMILEANGLDDAIWTMRNAVERGPEFDRFMRLLACDFAEHVLPIFEKRYPKDQRVRNAINVARAFANGEATATELIEARKAAAYAAAAAAYAAAYAAAAAAADAAYAAYAAAAADAAYAAAAAADAADAAARLAEKQWQSEHFKAALAAESERAAANADQGCGALGEVSA